MRPPLALFDLDGTLVDSRRHILHAMGAAFAALGRPVPPGDAILSAMGLSLPVVIARLAGDLPPADRERMRQVYLAAYHAERLRGPAPLFPGVAALLAGLQARRSVLIGLATGASRRGMRAMIECHGLRLATAQCADDHPSKPDPSMIRAALAETGLAPGDAVMIGDSSHDIGMARAAGLFALGVAWGYQAAEDLAAAGADAIVATPADLLARLDDHWGFDV